MIKLAASLNRKTVALAISSLASKRDEGFDWSLGAGHTEAAHAFSTDGGSRGDNIQTDPLRTFLNGNDTREGVNTSFSGGDVGLVWRSCRSAISIPMLAVGRLALPLQRRVALT